ncbi:MAG: alanine--tRNA ligase [Desulfobacteraceae bacterium]|nr:MAG: alanine--tRNA ligase [Desulfobacteraceae bacterium]
MTGNEVRRKFIEYFTQKGHQVVRSSSLVPHDDPTLLFTNAGMVQFKRLFIGEEKRNYNTATTSQKCVRAGGKHNDLENVGYTARHHTFFEMLGNFSFGDYFKEKAIEYAWELLVQGYGLPEDKLWVSIYLDDDEAYRIWQEQVGVPENRIVRLGEKDNFWAMGDTGPCGPCSEIHIDRGEAFGCGKPDCAVGCDCDRYLEIWNLVFMQFNRDESGKMTPLPKPSIDTGMGLERIASVLQKTPTNFETDLFRPIMQKVEALSGKKPGDSRDVDVAMKVIADHSRAAAFLIGDGVLPSNEGRGYVLRRIMRRAIRYGRNIGLEKPFLHETARTVFHIMEHAYPELKEADSFITNVIQNEEVRFSETLDYGLRLLHDTISELKSKGEKHIPGQMIFKLYDTYGFPVDIVQDVIRDQDMSLDMEGFHTAMKKQREQSRSITRFSTLGDAYKNLTSKGIHSKFVGYQSLCHDSNVILIVREGYELETAGQGETVEIVVEETPFYGESGGQVGDVGQITNTHFQMQVTSTFKDPTGLVIHRGNVLSGTVTKGEVVTLAVQEKERNRIALNHTATHILHAALRNILGDHVKQSGSLVASDRLRFDFNHFSAVNSNDLDKIEAYVNDRIRENFPVSSVEMDAEQALKTGATALFEEKYGDRVRVISLGDFSKEFCGGTHTGRTGNIGLFKIISESSVAAGIRRIEALTGEQAVSYIQEAVNILHQASGILKERPETLVQRIQKLTASLKSLEKEKEQLKSKMAMVSAGGAGDDYREINGIKVIAKKVSIDNPAALRDLADQFRDKVQSGIVVLGAVSGPKALLIVVVTKDLLKRFHAGNIIREVSAVVDGGGGGRPDMAQAGGTRPENLDMAIDKVYEIVARG